MSDVTVLVRVKLRLPHTKDFDEAEMIAQNIIEEELSKRLAVREVQMVKTESITS
jgi:hypothetical protein